MEINVEKYTLHVTQDELDLIYAGLSQITISNPRFCEVMSLTDKIRVYHSTNLNELEREGK